MKVKIAYLALGVAAASLCGAAGFQMYLKHKQQEQPEQIQVYYSPDEVTPQVAVAIANKVEESKDFTVFIYQCSKKHMLNVLIEHPDTEPKIRLIMSMTEGVKNAGHRYVPSGDGWQFLDTHGTTWKITAGNAVANDSGYSANEVCTFNLDKSTAATDASKNESPSMEYGV